MYINDSENIVVQSTKVDIVYHYITLIVSVSAITSSSQWSIYFTLQFYFLLEINRLYCSIELIFKDFVS